MNADDWRRQYLCEWPAPTVGDVVRVRGELVVLTEDGHRPATREERRWWRDRQR